MALLSLQYKSGTWRRHSGRLPNRLRIYGPGRTGHRGERLAFQPLHDPVAHRTRTDRAIKGDCRLVPVQDCPFQPRAIAFDRELRQTSKQRLADARPAGLGPDVQIFEINSGASLERREIVEEQREADRLAVALRDQHLSSWLRSEQVLGKPLAV